MGEGQPPAFARELASAPMDENLCLRDDVMAAQFCC